MVAQEENLKMRMNISGQPPKLMTKLAKQTKKKVKQGVDFEVILSAAQDRVSLAEKQKLEAI